MIVTGMIIDVGTLHLAHIPQRQEAGVGFQPMREPSCMALGTCCPEDTCGRVPADTFLLLLPVFSEILTEPLLGSAVPGNGDGQQFGPCLRHLRSSACSDQQRQNRPQGARPGCESLLHRSCTVFPGASHLSEPRFLQP